VSERTGDRGVAGRQRPQPLEARDRLVESALPLDHDPDIDAIFNDLANRLVRLQRQ